MHGVDVILFTGFECWFFNHGALRFTEVCTEVTEIVWKVEMSKSETVEETFGL
jgi:hypothetical protein